MRESGDNLEDDEVLWMAFMSHQGSIGCGGKRTSPSSVKFVGEDRDRWPSYSFSFPKYSA